MSSSLKPLKESLFKYGHMTIPSELIFYEKRFIYAIVPLALRLPNRKTKFLDFSSHCRHYDYSQTTGSRHERAYPS